VKIEVKLFAAARQFAGAECVALELPNGSTVADLRRALAERFPDARAIVEHSMFSLDMDFASDRELLRPGAEIACIPPVSGGD
jgi:molybdopterin converting factor subunit 1